MMKGTEKQIKYANDLINKVVEELKKKDTFMEDFNKLREKNKRKLANGEITEEKYNSRISKYPEMESKQNTEKKIRNEVIEDLYNIKENGDAGKVLKKLICIIETNRVYGRIISRKNPMNKHSKWNDFVKEACK